VFRKILRVTGLALVSLLLIAGALYQFFGLRFVMDGNKNMMPVIL
jgi:hypothetical protein